MLIAETGELMVMSGEPAFGNGAVIVNGATDVAGTYRLRRLATMPGAPRPPDSTCEIEGTVTERVSLQLDIHCTDDAGNATDRTVGLAYNPAYDVDSSLAEIQGTYTLSFSPQTNSLTIYPDGMIFGMFHNGGVNCTVNGQVEIIDAAFALYRFEFAFSLCQGSFAQAEGATLTGLGAPSMPGLPAGAFLLMIAGPGAGPLGIFSLLYEPV
jgi:hypothetical protein